MDVFANGIFVERYVWDFMDGVTLSRGVVWYSGALWRSDALDGWGTRRFDDTRVP